jgi:cytochrome c553
MKNPRRALHVLPLATALVATVALAQAQPKPFAAGDPAAAKPHYEKDCVSCHARRFDGDASRMYTRPDRKVRTAAQLLAQVQYCNAQLGTSYFPEEEEHLAAYLNLHYYKFAP